MEKKRKDDDIYGKINKGVMRERYAPVGKERNRKAFEKAKQCAAQKRELKKRQKDVETKKRTHRLRQIGEQWNRYWVLRLRKMISQS